MTTKPFGREEMQRLKLYTHIHIMYYLYHQLLWSTVYLIFVMFAVSYNNIFNCKPCLRSLSKRIRFSHELKYE